MNIKSFTKITSLAALALTLSVAAANAGSITGSLNFNSAYPPVTDTGNLATATKFTSIPGTTVNYGSTDAFSGLGGATATFNTPIVFTETGTNLLWTVTSGGNTFTFDETTIAIAPGRSTTFLNIAGSGEVFENGTNGTFGTWSITDTGTGGAGFTFSASTTTVPDSGSTALLIGLGVSALAVGVVASKRKSTVA